MRFEEKVGIGCVMGYFVMMLGLTGVNEAISLYQKHKDPVGYETRYLQEEVNRLNRRNRQLEHLKEKEPLMEVPFRTLEIPIKVLEAGAEILVYGTTREVSEEVSINKKRMEELREKLSELEK